MKIVYYRTAKTGSSSTCKAIDDSKYKTLYIQRREKDFLKLRSNNFDIVIVEVTPTVPKLYENIQTYLEEYVKNYESFCIVRCPYSRFKSSLNYCIDPFGEPFLNKMIREEKAFSSRCGKSKKGQRYLDIRFKLRASLQTRLNRTNLFREKPVFGRKEYEHIFRTQTGALYHDKILVPKNVIKFENLTNDVPAFFKKFGYNIGGIGHERKSRGTLELNQFHIDFVEEHFDEDFRNFDYSKYSDK